MSEFSQSDMSNLWIQAGGSPDVASLMGAIGMAESSGNPQAQNASSGACGLWQIHPAESGCQDAFTNAQMAVRKYNTQGLNAWEAYTNGSYKQFMGGSDFIPGNVWNQDQQSSACVTFNQLGVCWDGVVGLAATILGIGLIAAVVAIVAISSDQGKAVVQKTKKTVETGADIAVVAAA